MLGIRIARRPVHSIQLFVDPARDYQTLSTAPTSTQWICVRQDQTILVRPKKKWQDSS